MSFPPVFKGYNYNKMKSSFIFYSEFSATMRASARYVDQTSVRECLVRPSAIPYVRQPRMNMPVKLPAAPSRGGPTTRSTIPPWPRATCAIAVGVHRRRSVYIRGLVPSNPPRLTLNAKVLILHLSHPLLISYTLSLLVLSLLFF